MQLDFSDGSRVYQDPRREDPLIYVLPPDGWAGAVGFLAKPEYQEHDVASVTLAIHGAHETRLARLDTPALTLLVGRQAAARRKIFWHLKEQRLELPATLIERLGPEAVAGLFAEAGWRSQASGSTNSLLFVR